MHPDTRRAVFAPLVLLLALVAGPVTGYAQGQGGNGWFVPDQGKRPTPPPARPAQPAGQRGPAPVDATAPGQLPTGPIPGGEQFAPMVDPQAPLPPLQVQLPPMPEIPLIPKGSPTPAAIVGILSVPDVLRISTAYQAAYKELVTRHNKGIEDSQKEQTAQRELSQAFANERAKLTPEQIRTREKEYTDRFNDSRRKFSERERIIQEAHQYVMAQVERVIEQVAQQVAASRGVNLVLNRGQVLGTTADFDLTPQVADVLNKVLPTVVIPPDGVSPTKFNVPVAGPRVSATPDPAPAKKN